MATANATLRVITFALIIIAVGFVAGMFGATVMPHVVYLHSALARDRFGVSVGRAVLILTTGSEPTWMLVLSQVVLSFGIPFAIIPLVVVTARRTVMGVWVNAG